VTGTITARTDCTATILGSKGSLILKSKWWVPTEVILQMNDGKVETFQDNIKGLGYCYEAIVARECVEQGITECTLYPISELVSVMKLLDTIRHTILQPQCSHNTYTTE
jgi:hypothetical protein